jgi:hypothetical protein
MSATKSRWNRPLVWIIGGLLLAAVGCIAIPLGDPEKSKINEKLVGVWMGKPEDGGKQTVFTVTAFDARTYIVSDFDFTKDKDNVTIKGRMDWKMWLTDVGGQTFATCQAIDPKLLAQAKGDSTDEIYAIFKVVLTGDSLTVQTVDDDFVKAANVQNSQQLQDLITKNLDNPKLFSKEAAGLTRMTEEQKKDVSSVLDAFEGT